LVRCSLPCALWCVPLVSRSHHLISLSLGDYHCEIEMGDDALARDPRIKLSIGTEQRCSLDGQFDRAAGLVFDHHRGLLMVVDSQNHRVQVFSCDDDGGSFVSRFGEKGTQPGQLRNPEGIAIDHDHDRILVMDSGNSRAQSWSLSDQSFVPCIVSGDLGFGDPYNVAIDKHHRRTIITDALNDRLVFLSSIDLSFLFEVGGNEGSQPGEFYLPTGIATDDDRHRIIVCDTYNHRVQVLSLIDGSFLFEFGSQCDQPGHLDEPRGVCIDNHGRIIVADSYNYQLQAFTHEGHHISSFECGDEKPCAVAFDEHRGLIAFSAGNRVHVIGANQWLPDTFTWHPDRHRYAPSWMKQAVSTMTMIRSLIDECSAMSMIPNELLFEIFSFL